MNESTPRVSIIIPLYNKAPYIKRALDSALAQTIQDFEIIVVGGNSSDGGEDIVKKYTDSRIRFIQETGTGVSAARNQGVNVAHANLVAFLDADDEWLPEFLETILELKDRYPDAGIYGTGSTIVNQDTNNILEYNTTKDNIPILINDYFEYMYNYRTLLITPTSMAIPKKLFQTYQGFNTTMKWGEDRDLSCRIALKYPVAFNPNLQTIIHANSQNNSSSVISNMDSNFINCVVFGGKCLLKHPLYQSIVKYTDFWLMSIANNYYNRTHSSKLSKKYLKYVHNKKNINWLKFWLIFSIPPHISMFISHIKNKALRRFEGR